MTLASSPLDKDLTFNRGEWGNWIGSQSGLFRINALHDISGRLRDEFHAGHQAGRSMPLLRPAAAATPLLAPLHEKLAGYDLPCLIESREAPSQRRIMFCAQDPLRSGPGTGITVGTFFGIDNQWLRHSRRHYGVVWRLIRRSVSEGYGVWVTDAMKLWCKEGIDPQLREACAEVLREEVRRVSPKKIVAFGWAAATTLEQLGFIDRTVHVLHPAARRPTGWAGGTPANTPDDRMQARVDKYWTAISGA